MFPQSEFVPRLGYIRLEMCIHDTEKYENSVILLCENSIVNYTDKTKYMLLNTYSELGQRGTYHNLLYNNMWKGRGEARNTSD